ncbi:hypothetical protein JTE90_025878 [Oedothorax gibbosus]|uniref:TMC domain-containing protein n=1 Tax=Oedothorax gibbosus TaxID=931172 RepID=A0AAV6UPK1_9ARAC|nr:hypothetical protein JTE90_025878 [Oedothorax gibbosus]
MIAQNITETIDGPGFNLSRHGRSLLSFTDEGGMPTTTTLYAPYNCTYVVMHNCTLAALYSGVNLTDYLASTSSTADNYTVDGDYFLDNSTEEDMGYGYGSMVGSIANLTAFGMASWNVSSAIPTGPHINLPPVFFNVSSSFDLEEGKITWDIPLDYGGIADNWTSEYNISSLEDFFSTAFWYNDTTTFQSTTTDDESSTSTTTTESPWPPELNCTVVIPVCTTLTTFTDDTGPFSTTEDGFDSTTGEGTDDLAFNGTDTADENATLRETCLRFIPEEFVCRKTCEGERPYRMPTQQDLLAIPGEMKDQLRKRCWETAFGQELVKLTVMDLVMTVVTTIGTDFFRAVFVRYANNCWCWDLEKGFPGYGDFKIAENILHLVNNQGLVWMGMFFSPGLPAINTVKLCILVYVRSWAVLTANIPHETVFKASKSNNFYYALLLIMLFLCTLPVGFACVWLEPSWHCGPFSDQHRIYNVLTSYVLNALPTFMVEVVQYFTSPGVVIPLLLLLILIIYYLTSLNGSLREANNDLKIQLRREKSDREKPKVEEKRKRVQVSDSDHPDGLEDKKAMREDIDKDRSSVRRPSPLSVGESHKSSSDGEDRRWMRRGGITGNGDLPLITISQASEGRDSMSSLNSSEDAAPVTPPSTSSASNRMIRRFGLIPSVSEQDEENDEEENDDQLSIEIHDDTHFEPIKDDDEEQGYNGKEEVNVVPETVEAVAEPRDHAEIKALTGCGAPLFRHADESSSTDDRETDDYHRHATLPVGVTRGGRTTPHRLRRSKAVKGSDSMGDSTDSNTLRPPSPSEGDVKRAKIQRLDTDSL